MDTVPYVVGILPERLVSGAMDEQPNPLESDHSLCVIVPGRAEEETTVHGSQPVMDLLVTLCASYRLNPSDYAVEFLSRSRNSVGFTPNSPVGLLGAETIVLRLKGAEEKVKKPYVPEATVRLLISYNKAHRAVLRVNPKSPLEALLPLVCDKCEFNMGTTVLLRDSRSREPLDVTKSLDDHGLREVFARDTAAATEAPGTRAEVVSPSHLQGKKEKKRGFFSLFRRREKKNEVHQTVSAPVSPGVKPARVRVASESTLAADASKKRRAPPPPASHSVPDDLGGSHAKEQKSAESSSRSRKRRAPPAPPSANASQDLREGTDIREPLNTVEELQETDESHVASASPRASQPPPSLSSWRQSLAHLHEESDLHLPTFRGRDLGDARCALAKVLTSSVSRGALVRRFRNSAAFASCVATTPDDQDLRAELEPAFSCQLLTDEWEHPGQSWGTTTFRVVPAEKSDQILDGGSGSESSPDVEEEEKEDTPGIPDGESMEPSGNDASSSPPPQRDVETPSPPDAEEDEEKEPDCSDGEEASEDPKEFNQSPVPDGKNPEEDDEEEGMSFPPPPPPVFFPGDDKLSEEEDPTASSTSVGDAPARRPTSELPPDTKTSAPSKFAQAVAVAVHRSRLHSSSKGLTSQNTLQSTYQYGA